ncbi:methyltransferase domain-containing protein [Bordetella hinzii]|uniref:methyltransferase domain-containing protein n=1 Tax=Bordetella hinzii TaxID=103855 RepID=UPI0013EFFD58|nr:methyltransferase domain-containing protein [Bordetella hinzii]QII86721.1 methyltransferase domain-containing protein [Bordetella hinzii]
MKQRVMLTLDVEAQPARAPSDHIQRLILGRLGGEPASGIEQMFDIAERHGVGMTCFLDYAEEYLYGDALLDVGRYIRSRGQDLQVHLHPEFIPHAEFDRRGVKHQIDMFEARSEQAGVLIEIAVDAHMRVAKAAPLAFRGGGYRYGDAVLNELARQGFLFNSGYNPSRANQPFNIGARKQFRWANGLTELPIACVPNYKNTGRVFDYNFNADVLIKGSVDDCVLKHEEYLQQYFGLFGDDAIAVMVMHSWSFLGLNEVGHYSSVIPEAARKFDALLTLLSQKYEVVTASSLARGGALADAMTFKFEKNTMQTKKSEARAASGDALQCDVCGAGEDRIQDFNGPKRKCGVCGSLERQRAFASLVNSKEWPLDWRNTRVLLISPSVSERKLFGSREGVQLSTLDVRAEVRPDIVADLCNMENVASGSFDVIYACHVLSHVHDLPAALSEIARVLSQDGVFISFEPSSSNSATREIKNVEEIWAYYGRETYEKYKVGRFRSFGEVDIDAIFSPHFIREKHEARDRITGVSMIWNVWRKRTRITPAAKTAHYSVTACPMCNSALYEVEAGQNCPQCGSRARVRSMAPLVDQYIKNHIPGLAVTKQPLLAFAMTAAEQKLLVPVFKRFKSVSLFGNYGDDHEMGVDMRDLSRYSSDSFSGVFGCLLFDYFPEHEKALRECYRVTEPGGIFFTHIAPYRLLDGDAEPVLKGKIKSRSGYFEYLPEKTELPDVKVGRDWFSDAMKRVGFDVTVVHVRDEPSGLVSEWFVGIKPQDTRPATRPTGAGAAALRGEFAEVFRSIVPLGRGDGRLKIELLQTSPMSLLFLEDHCKAGGSEAREILATNGSRERVYVSRDLGLSWRQLYEGIEWDGMIRSAFTLADGGRLVRSMSGSIYHFDRDERLVGHCQTGIWHWHGSQGVGQSTTGTVMYAEYAPLRKEHGLQALSVWRYRGGNWERVMTLPARDNPPEGALRHFHVCQPYPGQPGRWLLSSGDTGEHIHVWISEDDGDSWKEIPAPERLISDTQLEAYPEPLRFTQCAMLENGDVLWGTDDVRRAGRSALIRMSFTGDQPTFTFQGWLGRNCVRNITSYRDKYFLMLSETLYAPAAADCHLFDAESNRITSLLLPNVGESGHPVTDSLGSARLVDGIGFYPALGAVLMDPKKRGIFRVTLEEMKS